MPLFGIEGVQIHVPAADGIAGAVGARNVSRFGFALVVFSPNEVVDHILIVPQIASELFFIYQTLN